MIPLVSQLYYPPNAVFFCLLILSFTLIDLTLRHRDQLAPWSVKYIITQSYTGGTQFGSPRIMWAGLHGNIRSHPGSMAILSSILLRALTVYLLFTLMNSMCLLTEGRLILIRGLSGELCCWEAGFCQTNNRGCRRQTCFQRRDLNQQALSYHKCASSYDYRTNSETTR